ncbi:hypothetical protein VE04_09358, partial [Pseudogymnoascus sp. 24MN13]
MREPRAAGCVAWEDAGGREGRVVLVFDGVDRQRDAPPTLVPALARLGEVIPNLTTVFVVTSPRPHFLHNPGAPHVHFPSYTKAEAVAIVSRSVPSIYPSSPLEATAGSDSDNVAIEGEEDIAVLHPTAKETADLYSRFLSAVWDTFAKYAGRDILSFRRIALTLWPRFTAPIRAGVYGPRDKPSAANSLANKHALTTPPLPYTSRILLIAAYLASYTPARLDTLLFAKSSGPTKKRRKNLGGNATKPRPGTAARRMLNRKCSGRRREWGGEGGGGGADVLAAVAGLASLRLLGKTSRVADP